MINLNGANIYKLVISTKELVLSTKLWAHLPDFIDYLK